MQNEDIFKKIERQNIEAKKFGFYWENINQLIEKIQSECSEVQEAWESGNLKHLQEEIGDLIQASISMAVFCHLDPQETLSISFEKFQQRYKAVVQMAQNDGHKNLQKQPFDVLINYWNLAKRQTKSNT